MKLSRDILHEAAMRTGWNESSMIDVLTDYIDNQQNNRAFEDYINERVFEEERP